MTQDKQQRYKNYIKTYLIYERHEKRDKTDLLGQFKLQPAVFFNKRKAFSGAKYFGKNATVFLAYIPEAAIIGSYDELLLNPEYIQRKHLRGYFPDIHQAELYIDLSKK